MRALLHHRSAFTLLEVVLAVSIAIGLLLVVLYFYRQAADLRTELLKEAERVSATRLIMDRITADLRTARNDAAAGKTLSGSATSLRLLRTDPPSRAAWTGSRLGRAGFAETDLKWVDYSVGSATEGTNVVATGLTRTEQPYVELKPMSAARRQNQVTVEVEETKPPAAEPLSDAIRYVRFRYFDGAKWTESWSGARLPLGVEVTLAEAAPEETTTPEEKPGEFFRRVIYLPGSSAEETSDSLWEFLMEGEL
ncbi:MAG: hypothetical protein HZA90_23500 [Verrucomicrobia bacterium]|nr:hypothetical protein [Verrucomicrobiota bacterium]